MTTKILAGLVSLSLIVVSPGLASYAAAADMVRGPAGTNVGAAAVARPGAPSFSKPGTLPGSTVLTKTPGAIPGAVSAAGVSAEQAGAQASPAERVSAAVSELKAGVVTTEDMSRIGEGQAAEAARADFGRMSGENLIVPASADVDGPQGSAAANRALSASGGITLATSNRQQPPAPPSGPTTAQPSGPRGSRVLGFFGFVARVAAGAGLVYGLQQAAVALAPLTFGLPGAPAIWAVAGGALWLYFALQSRARLGLRDSKGLTKTKWVMDGMIGAFAGAAALAIPAFWGDIAAFALSTTGQLALGTTLGAIFSRAVPAGGINMVLGGAALIGTPLLFAAGVPGLIAIGPLLGAMALAAAITAAFFTPQIINSAETGRPFGGLGSMQKFRFPTFPWLMTGVVFALMSGYAEIYTTWAWILWSLFGNNSGLPKWDKSLPAKQNLIGLATNFNVYYFGLLAFVAATGFTSPLTFLVIAFSVERAAMWMEVGLGSLLPKKAMPSTKPAQPERKPLAERLEKAWPKSHHWLRTGLLLGTMFGATLLFSLGITEGTLAVKALALGKYLGISTALTMIPLFFSAWLIRKVMQAQDTDKEKDPEVFEIMADLRTRLNATLPKNKQLPEIGSPGFQIVNVPMDIPNAFATGRDPQHALVGVTVGIKKMLLDPNGLREGLIRMLGSPTLDAQQYEAFRIAMAGGVTGVTLQSTPAEAAQAVQRASDEELAPFGKRLLRGVLAHEFSHVMDRHMVTGGAAGAMSSAVGFMSYGVLWGMGQARKKLVALKDKILSVVTGRPAKPSRVELFDPVSTGAIIVAMLRAFAALWVPVIFSIVQMTGSRNNESQADYDGGKLSEDPTALALALGLLMSWRPPTAKSVVGPEDMPRLAAAAQFMTVNPLQQLDKAGAVPASGGFGRGDGALQEMFITHPETGSRILQLLEMARAIGQDKNPPRAQPPQKEGGGGAQAPPGAGSASQAQNAPAQSRGASLRAAARGAVRGAWDRIVRVLPDPARNRALWRLLAGLGVLQAGQSFHYSGLKGTIAPTDADLDRVNQNRAINSSAQLVSSFLTGPAMDSLSVGRMLVVTHLWRALVLLPVPFLYYLSWTFDSPGWMFLASFHMIIGIAGFLQTISATAGQMAFSRVLRGYEQFANKANSMLAVVTGMIGVAAPLAAGWFIVQMNVLLGDALGSQIGYALCYAVYSATLFTVAWIYRERKLAIPRDELSQARSELAAALKGRDGVRGVRTERAEENDGTVERLVIEVRGDPKTYSGLPSEFQGYATVVRERQGRWRQLVDGFLTIWRSKFLFRYMLFLTVPVLIFDPILFGVLPAYLHQIGASGAAFTHYLAASALGGGVISLGMIFWHGSEVNDWQKLSKRAQAARPGAAKALDEAMTEVLAGYRRRWAADASFDPAARFASDVADAARARLGAAIGLETYGELRAWLSRHAEKRLASERREALGGMTRLERQATASAWLNAVSWLLYIGILFAPTLSLSVLCMVLATAAGAPASNIWASVLQKYVNDNAHESMGKVYSFLLFYQLAFGVLGSFGAVWLMQTFRADLTPVIHIAGWLIVAAAALTALEPHVLFPIKRAVRRAAGMMGLLPARS